MSAIDIFQYGQRDVRVIAIEGESWFVAADVLAILELDRTALRRLDDDEKGVGSIHTPGGQQTVTTISEPGLYALVLGSRKREAVEFQRWVTHDVLPAIRRTGQYVAPTSDIDQIKALHSAVGTLLLEREQQSAQIAVLTPRAAAWDELADASGDYEVADAAKILARAGIDVGRTRLFDRLEDMGWVFRGPADKYGPGKWKARQSAVDSGYLAERPQSHHHPRTGLVVIDPPQVRVTLRGIERLRVRLGRLDAPALHAVEGTNA